MTATTRILIVSMLVCTTTLGWAATPIIYPANGQDMATQQNDEGECFVWARNQTGFDPLAQTTVQAAAPAQQQGRALRGAARGAVVGGIVGDSDDAAKGAAIGAVVGRSRQNRQNRAATEQAQSQAANAQATQNAGRQEYDRAYAVCLEGRGYTVR